jgi:hypothetical protein
MPRAGQRAKLLPSLLGIETVVPAGSDVLNPGSKNIRSNALDAPAPISSLAITLATARPSKAEPILDLERVLVGKGGATALGFRPSYWAYDADAKSGDDRLDPLPLSTETDRLDAVEAEEPSTGSSTLVAREPNHASEPASIDADSHQETQQALAASLTEIIDDVLRTRRFAVRAVDVSRRVSV